MDVDAWAAVVVWPLMLLAAWLAGEWLAQHANVPRVCAYGAVGLALSGLGLTQGVASHQALGWMANLALALTLFELGYRINPRWFLRNPWVLVAGLAQAALTFAVVMWVGGLFGLAMSPRLVLAALCVATSPAAVMRVTHDLRSSGQVTERLLHLCALNCLLAVLLFKCVVGYWHLETSGDWGKAAFNSIYVIGLSMVAGAAFGVLAPVLNQLVNTRNSGNQSSNQSTTVTFALGVLLLTGVAQSLQLSPLLAALAFGALARERRVMLSHAQRNFGALGDVLTVFLFVFIGSLLSWEGLLGSLLLGAVVLGARSGVHVLVNVGVARISGTTFRKGALTGLSLMPMSAFALLLLEESRRYGFDVGRESLPVIVGLLVMQDVIGPWVTQRALVWAGEAQPPATSLTTSVTAQERGA
jgi:Kef-type K+ transport system membrane component KefB